MTRTPAQFLHTGRVVIIGGGIGGLAAAVALQRRRFTVRVWAMPPIP